MYLKIITREGTGRKKDFRVRYLDSDSAEGRRELLKRYYGLKELKPGSYFSMATDADAELFDWGLGAERAS